MSVFHGKIKRVKLKLIRLRQQIRAKGLRKSLGQGSYIPPEVVNDDFASWITKIVVKPEVKILIEIGSSSGEGSTLAIMKGLKEKNSWSLHLLEVDPLRLESLKRKFLKKNGVFIHRYSSVSISEYPTPEDVVQFYNSTPTNLNRWPIDTILHWMAEDKKNLMNSGLAQLNGINQIKKDFGIKHFDFALIDGSEFTGFADLRSLLGARYILLDDINAFKCNQAYKALKDDPRYTLEYENWKLRNGFAVFSIVDPLIFEEMHSSS
jgi:hypothetical protein